MDRYFQFDEPLDPMNCSCLSPTNDEPALSSEEKRMLTNGKATVAVIVFFLTLGAELLPWCLVRFKRAVELLGLGACFAAGVILGAAFCHMAPDSEAAWVAYFEHFTSQDPPQKPPGLTKIDHAGYPFGQFIAVVALLLLMAVDTLLVRGGLTGHGHSHGGEGGHSHAVPQLPANYQEGDANMELGGKEGIESPSVLSQNGHQHPIKNGWAQTSDSPLNPKFERGSQEQIAQAWIFFFALAIHSIFDGLSLGAEGHLSGFYALLVAILCHKWLDGFALGVTVYFANFSQLNMWFSLIFCAAMTPLGIGIGMAATEGTEGVSGQLAKAIILSLSTGSFYFIALIELLPSGLADGRFMKLKFAITAAGFGFMALIAIWV